MISQTMEYALRAAVFLANNAHQPRTTRQIAQATRVPQAYLAKVMQQLVEAGLVRGQRGIGGGFTLLKRPENVSLLELVSAVELLQRMPLCPTGSLPPGKRRCSLHKWLDDAMATLETVFAKTMLAEIIDNRADNVPLCSPLNACDCHAMPNKTTLAEILEEPTKSIPLGEFPPHKVALSSSSSR